MTTLDEPLGISGSPGTECAAAPARTVIAAVVERQGRIALFRRSMSLGHDAGLWHCITGFVEAGTSPEQQALEELYEETGLQAKDLLSLRQGPALKIADEAGTAWLVHTFVALTSRRRLSLNWENDSYRWTAPHRAKRFSNQVVWLENVLQATGHYPDSFPELKLNPEPALQETFRKRQ